MTTTQLPAMNELDGETLTAMGYPVELRDKCVGVQVVVRAGTTVEQARYLAWCDGKARLSSGNGAQMANTGECPAWLDAALSGTAAAA
jgi:Ser/Thr protein kinase RdoA (MazF antagonist)